MVCRRFSDFDWLQARLQAEEKYKGCVYPILPCKKLLGNNSEEFVEQRKQELQLYLQMLGKHSLLKYDPTFKVFLTCEDPEEFERSKQDPRCQAAESSIPMNSLRRFQLHDTFNYLYSSIKSKLFDKSEPEEIQIGPKLDEILEKIAKYVPFLEKSIYVLEESLRYQKHFAMSQETVAKTFESAKDADPELEKTCQSVMDYHSKYAMLIRVRARVCDL